MFWFKHKKKQAETLEEKYQRLVNFYLGMIEKKPEVLRKLMSEGDERLVLENFSYQVGNYSEVAIMQWRHGDDPRPMISGMFKAYEDLLAFRQKIDPDENYAMQDFRGMVDWDMVYLMLWLTKRNMSLDLYNSVDVEDRYYDYSRYMTYLITDNIPPKELKEKCLNAVENHSGLVDIHFQDICKILDEVPTSESTEQIIQRLNANWQKRRASSYYRRIAPSMTGSDHSNELSLDFYLACALRKKNLSTNIIHQWKWDEPVD